MDQMDLFRCSLCTGPLKWHAHCVLLGALCHSTWAVPLHVISPQISHNRSEIPIPPQGPQPAPPFFCRKTDHHTYRGLGEWSKRKRTFIKPSEKWCFTSPLPMCSESLSCYLLCDSRQIG